MTSWTSTLKWCDEQREAELERLTKERPKPLFPVGDEHPGRSELLMVAETMRQHIDDVWKLLTSHRYKITQLEHPEWYDTHA